MAKCDVCKNDMLTAAGCNNHIYIMNNGNEVKPVRVGDEGDWLEGETEGRCGDCNASVGETHHVGCDIERCAVCGGQFISCGCDYSDRLLIVEHNEQNQ